MKIIAVTAKQNGIYKDDTDVFCEGLLNGGHTLKRIYVDEINKTLYANCINLKELKEYDVIWSPYERENVVACEIKARINLPIVGHYEWIPVFRTGQENPLLWGLLPEQLKAQEKVIPRFTEMYKSLIPYWLKCDIKTISDKYALNTINYIQDTHLTIDDLEIKPYPIDDKLLLSQKNESIEEKYQVMSTARVVPTKRLHHIIKALGMLKNPPDYKIIGRGPEMSNLINLAKKYKVSLEFMGTGQKGDKARIIQESMMSLNPWAWLPIGESAVLKTPAITYDCITAQQKLGNIPAKMVPNNDIKKFSEAIQYLIDNPEERKKAGEKAYNELMSGNAEMYPQELAVKKLVEILEKVRKKS